LETTSRGLTMKRLSEQLAELIQRAGNYSEIARRADLDPSQVARLAKGERTGRKDTLDKIGVAMRLVITYGDEGGCTAGNDPHGKELRQAIAWCREEVAAAAKEVEKATKKLARAAQALEELQQRIG
jgi:transcriptional regulator with XRE-family HTH domain